jgi:hypothetical protein
VPQTPEEVVEAGHRRGEHVESSLVFSRLCTSFVNPRSIRVPVACVGFVASLSRGD